MNKLKEHQDKIMYVLYQNIKNQTYIIFAVKFHHSMSVPSHEIFLNIFIL